MSQELIEPFAVSEFFADGIDSISVVNGVFRCIFWSWQTVPPNNVPTKVAVQRFMMPVSSVPTAAAIALQALALASVTQPSNVFCEAERPTLAS